MHTPMGVKAQMLDRSAGLALSPASTPSEALRPEGRGTDDWPLYEAGRWCSDRHGELPNDHEGGEEPTELTLEAVPTDCRLSSICCPIGTPLPASAEAFLPSSSKASCTPTETQFPTTRSTCPLKSPPKTSPSEEKKRFRSGASPPHWIAQSTRKELRDHVVKHTYLAHDSADQPWTFLHSC